MRIAIPVKNGQLNAHFGQSEQFLLVNADPQTKQILASEVKSAPEQQHGAIPPWLIAEGVTHVIAGGMGGHMQQFLASQSIAVTGGIQGGEPLELAKQLLDGTLAGGATSCSCSCSH